MQEKPLLLMQAGDAPQYILERHYNFDKMFLRMADYSGLTVETVRVFEGEPLKPHGEYCGIIMTGSTAMVTDKAPWSVQCAAWLKEAVENDLPFLGVCYGHQLLAHAFGGKVGPLPGGPEIGTHKVTMQPGAGEYDLLRYLPGSFLANMYHEQTVLKVPSAATVLGSSSQDPHQILAYGPYALTVQFHPEFTGEIVESCIEWAMASEDAPPALQKKRAKLLAGAEDTPVAASVLKLFVHLLAES